MGSDRRRHCHVLNCYFDRKCSFGRFYTCSNVSILNVHNVKANSVDPDQTAHYEQFDQDLHYLPFSFVHSKSALVKYSCP